MNKAFSHLKKSGGALSGVRDAVPAGFAILPIGLAFGVLVVQSGLEWWWATLFSAIIFASSFEFLFLGLVLSSTSISSIAISALLVNSRHIFYSLSFPLHRIPMWAKFYSTFALTDEAWALTSSPSAREYKASRILALQATFHASWISSVTLGAVLGSLIPEPVKGLEFALTALFIVLCIDALQGRQGLRNISIAIACAFFARYIGGSSALLIGGITFYTIYVIVRFNIISKRGSNAHK